VQPLTPMPKPLAHDSYGAWRSPWKVRWGKPCSLMNRVNALVTSWGIKGKPLGLVNTYPVVGNPCAI